MTDRPFGRRIPAEESLAAITRSAPSKERPADSTVPATPDAAPMGAGDSFIARPPRATLADVIMSAPTAQAVETALARIRHHDTLFNEWGLDRLEPAGKRVVLNLYGPPGTGKTLCAEAIAGHLNCHLIEVSYAEIESKYVGETPKNIVAAFRRASETGAVLFFDEADSILGRRMTNVTQAADHSVNVSRAVMLKELDAFEGVVIFATNLPKNFDGAFVRRILSHIEFPLPDEPTRKRLWEQLLPERLPGREDLDLNQLARVSDALSGGDLKNAIIAAASAAVLRNGASKRVMMEDVLHSIEQCKMSKSHVGAIDSRTMVVEEVSH